MSTVLTFIISFIALLWAANHVVVGAAGLSARLRFSPFIVGITLIALATSGPEIMISIVSSINNKSDLAIGNAIGSNIANIGLVLGLTSLIKPITLNFSILKRAYPLMLIIMIFSYSLILDGFLGRIDGCLFLIGCITMISTFIYVEYRSSKQDKVIDAFKSAAFANCSLTSSILNLILGLVILPLSTKYLVGSAAEIAQWAGLSELTVGLTIVSMGTTLPELVTAINAALKDEEDLAIGVILGSNIYNLLFIMAFPAIINPGEVNPSVLWQHMPVLISLTILLLFLGFQYKNTLSRWHGSILLLIYFSYIASIVINAL